MVDFHGANSTTTGTAGNSPSVATTLPPSIPNESLAVAFASNSNGSVMSMDSAGWTLLSNQSLGSQDTAAWVKAVESANSQEDLQISQAVGSRIALGVVVVAGAAGYEVGPPLVNSTGNLTVDLPAATPAQDDSILIAVAGVRHAQTPTPGVTAPGGWVECVDASTTNTSSAHAGVWAATRVITGGGGVEVPASTGSSSSASGEAVWVVRVAPAVVPSGIYEAGGAYWWDHTAAAWVGST